MKYKMSLLLMVFMCLSQVLQPVLAEEIINDPGQITEEENLISETQEAEPVISDEPQSEIQPAEEETVYEITTSSDSDNSYYLEDDIDHDAMFAGYVDQAFGISEEDSSEMSVLDSIHTNSVNSSEQISVSYKLGDRLKGNDKTVYDILYGRIQQILDGTLTSTEFGLTLEDFGLSSSFTAADLGVNSIILNSAINPAATAAFEAKIAFNLEKVVTALLKDYPYEMFWFDGTKEAGGYSSPLSFGYSADSTALTVTSLTYSVNLPVSANYSATGAQGTYDLNPDISRIKPAAAKAQDIVSKNSAYSDYEKLVRYSTKICDLTSYNSDAANDANNIPYGDPWQLIWVFDGDVNTTVVCEGYSKAFKYLCDLTDFDNNSIHCILADGTMDGGTGAGAHMWNVVTMDNGSNYLVDVTNCDDGTIGQGQLLFLRGTDTYYGVSGTVTKTVGEETQTYPYVSRKYDFDVNGTTISYIYSYETVTSYDLDTELSLSGSDYEDLVVEEIPHNLVFASDRHSQPNAILEAMTPIKDVIGDEVEYVSMVGDMVDRTLSYSSSAVLSEIQSVFSNIDAEHASIIWGTHDAQCNEDTSPTMVYGRTGGSSKKIYTGYNSDGTPAYHVYAIAFYDMASGSGVSKSSVLNYAQTSVARFKQWVDELNAQGDDSPIIVLCHAPMHTKRGDNVGASFWNEALNYAATAGGFSAVQRKVVFLHGHNHTIDPAEYYYEPGTFLSIQGPDSGVDSKIYYTYMTAGYLMGQNGNPLRDASLLTVANDDHIKITKFENAGLAFVNDINSLFLDLGSRKFTDYQNSAGTQINYTLYNDSQPVKPDEVNFEYSGSVVSDISDDGYVTFNGNAGSETVKIICTYDGMTAEHDIDITLYQVTGQCGDDAYWNFDPESGAMTITGTGSMYSYSTSSTNLPPWNDIKNDIREVIISHGITTVGSYAFYGCTSLEKAIIGNGVTTINSAAFSGCTSLSSIELPATISTIYTGSTTTNAFYNCSKLTDVYFTGTEEAWNSNTACTSALADKTVYYMAVNHIHTGHEDDYCDICGLETEYDVILTSALQGDSSGTTVANLKGGGSYQAGESEYGADVTVIAPAKLGFDFVGWYEGTEYTADSTLVSTEKSYSFKVYDDVNLIAVYKTTSSTFTVKATASKFRITGFDTDQTDIVRDYIPGTSITVNYVDESKEFKYWANDAGKILSTEKEYTFTLVSPVTLKAKSVAADETGTATAFVEFISYYNQVIGAGTYTADSAITPPAGPSRIGYNFTKWSPDVDGIKAKIAAGDTYIVVKPEYEKSQNTSVLTIDYQSMQAENEEVLVTEGIPVTVNANDFEDYKFAYWKDSTGTVLSTLKDYRLLTLRDTTICPVYVSETEADPEQYPVIAMTGAAAKVESGKNKIYYIVTRSIPEGYTVTENGLIYSASTAFADTDLKDTLILGADGVKTGVSKTSGSGVYSFAVNVGIQTDTTVYGRGYMVIKNDQTGDESVIYSENIYTYTYNELNNTSASAQ